MTFIRQVSYLVVRIFRYFMPAEHPRTFGPDGIPSLYPGGDSERISINFWTDIFENLPSSSPNEAEEPSVTRIEWKKNKGAIGHEWLLATIERKDGSKSYLRLERRPSSAQLLTEEFTKIVDTRPGVQKALKKALREERAFLSNPIWVSSQKSMSVRGPVQAQDTIVQTRNATGQLIKSLEDAEVVTSYSNFKKPLYLKDLIFAACTTSQASDEYLLFLQQCYWFSRTIVGIITTHYYPDISPGPYFSDSGKLRLSQGKWSFQINEENRREVTKLAVELTKRLKAYNDMLQQRYEDGRGGRIAAEQKLEQNDRVSREKEQLWKEKEEQLKRQNEELILELERNQEGPRTARSRTSSRVGGSSRVAATMQGE